jgi:hypothetical protein
MNQKYIHSGRPTKHLLNKLGIFKKIYFRNLPTFCKKYSLTEGDFAIDKLFLIGSNAKDSGWTNNSDTDLKIVNDLVIPEYLWKYKDEVLDPLLCKGKKSEWIDIFFAVRDDQILHPRYDLTSYFK